MHSHGPEENPQMKAHDLGGVNVLIAGKFHYLGALGLELPPHWDKLKESRAHKNRFSQEKIGDFLEFISSYPQGVSAPEAALPGAGVFQRFSPALQLTAPNAEQTSTWELPG